MNPGEQIPFIKRLGQESHNSILQCGVASAIIGISGDQDSWYIDA
jgi:hypothetical protein